MLAILVPKKGLLLHESMLHNKYQEICLHHYALTASYRLRR